MSSGAIKRKTANFGLNIINYDFPRWHTFDWQNWGIVDAVLSSANLISVRGAWENSTSYLQGDRVADDIGNSLWVCNVSHTSAASGTFLEDRTANPTFWTVISSVPIYRGTWATATNYVTQDVIKQGNAYYLCISPHISDVFIDDLNAGRWTLIMDASDAINAAAAADNSAQLAEDWAISPTLVAGTDYSSKYYALLAQQLLSNFAPEAVVVAGTDTVMLVNSLGVYQSIMANASKSVMIGISDAPELSLGELQFLVGTAPNPVNRWKLTGGNNGSSPVLETTSPVDADVPGTIVTKGKGPLVIGMGAGEVLRVEDNGANTNINGSFKVSGGSGSNQPTLRSNRGATIMVSATNEFTIASGTDPLTFYNLVRVRRSGTNPPRNLLIEISDVSTTITPSAGGITVALPSATDLFNVSGGIRYTGRHVQTYNAQTPSSGFSYVMAAGTAHLILQNGTGATIASGSVTLPPSPVDGEMFCISSDMPITVLTLIAGTGGASIWGNPGTISAGSPLRFKYMGSTFNKWVRM